MTLSISATILSGLLTTTSPIHDGSSIQKEISPIISSASTSLVHRTSAKIGDTFQASLASLSNVSQLSQQQSNNVLDFRQIPLAEQVVVIAEGNTVAHEILTNIEQKGGSISDENLLEEVFRQGKDQMFRIFNNLDSRPMGSKDWLKSLIELLAIINFFTLLPWAYKQTIMGAKDGTGAKAITFSAFTISNALGMSASIISGSPLLGAGYMVAFISAIRTAYALSNRKKLNVNQAKELQKAREKIQELLENIKQLSTK